MRHLTQSEPAQAHCRARRIPTSHLAIFAGALAVLAVWIYWLGYLCLQLAHAILPTPTP